jgi:flagellar motor protein MotB
MFVAVKVKTKNTISEIIKKIHYQQKEQKKIHDYLLTKGIDSSRISFKGYEFENPIYYPEKNERHRSLNRRVEVKVLEN